MDNQIIYEDIERVKAEFDLSALQGKTVLITGATGLIGTYMIFSILDWNKRENNKINLHIITHQGLPAHLKEISSCDNVTLHQGDLTDAQFIHSLIKFDAIVHAAGYGQPGKFMEDEIKTIRLNTLATELLLQKVKKDGYFLFVSTSEVYSGSKDLPYTEETYGVTMPDHPRACYIEGKRGGEAICHAYVRMGYKVKIARVALAYGPGVRATDKRVLYNFIQKAIKGDIAMLDRGEAKRVYCYVADTVSLLWNILLKGGHTVYNVGGMSHTTIAELAQLVADYMEVKVIYPKADTGMQGAPQDVYMDMNRAMTEFNKKDFLPLKEGVERTALWYRENMQ